MRTLSTNERTSSGYLIKRGAREPERIGDIARGGRGRIVGEIDRPSSPHSHHSFSLLHLRRFWPPLSRFPMISLVLSFSSFAPSRRGLAVLVGPDEEAEEDDGNSYGLLGPNITLLCVSQLSFLIYTIEGFYFGGKKIEDFIIQLLGYFISSQIMKI